MRPFLVVSASLAIAALAGGCASVPVRKVPTPTQYTVWTDAMQKSADSMKGIRFYLPRPFVNVFESFPVRTDVAIADGLISPDGQYVIIKRVRGSGPLARAFNGHPEFTVPGGVLFRSDRDVNAQGDGNKSGANTKTGDAGSSTGTVVPAEPEIPAPPRPLSEPATAAPPVKTGQASRKVTNDNGAFAYQPLRGNMDLVYIPDFEEQYVVDAKSGLGNAQFEINLGQGWSLQGFNSLADNSALNQRIFELVDHAMTLASSAADAVSGRLLPMISKAAKSGTAGEMRLVGADLQGEGKTPLAPPATPVSLKIVQIHYAAKGLYPVIKPRELAMRTVSGSQTTMNIQSLSNLFDVPTATTLAEQAASFTVPRYPYQYISFNTFSYVAIELVKTDSVPFGTLYDATGTQGSNGESRTDEQLIGLLRSLTVGSNGEPPILGPGGSKSDSQSRTDTKTNDSDVSFSRDFMKTNPHVSSTADPTRSYTLSGTRLANGELTATLNVLKGKPVDVDEGEANASFVAQLNEFAKKRGVTAPTLKFTNLLEASAAKAATLNKAIVRDVHYPVAVDRSAAGAKYYAVKTVFVEATGENTARATVELAAGTAGNAPSGSDDDIEKGLQPQIEAILKGEFKDVTVTAVVIRSK